ncbi:MAG: MFS transporter [Bacteroidales bacterium]|nr:MFS transporter [Bacteroidales bacterium]
MKTKPDLGFWKLWNLSFGFFGVQIAYALQSANVSRIFATLGADPHDLSYFWILPPLMGLIVQPIVGTLSDKTWNRFGRRLPYLIIGALVAVIVMCLLPNAGSFGLAVSSAILIGLIALMLLDTSINMAMQPFKMLVGDMVNEKQKGLAYSIQSFLCNAGSIVGYVFPFILTWIGFQNTAAEGVIPETVIYSFYIGAAILLLCVVYSLAKIKEWPPHIYAEYNGGGETKTEGKKEKTNVFKLLAKAPTTFWTVGLVQFFCWFAFLFMWTYTNGTIAKNAFDCPETTSIYGITDGDQTFSKKYILYNDTTVIMENGKATVAGYECPEKPGEVIPVHSLAILREGAAPVQVVNNDLITSTNGVANFRFGEIINTEGAKLSINGGLPQDAPQSITLVDHLSIIHKVNKPINITLAGIVTHDPHTGALFIDEAEVKELKHPRLAEFATHVVLNTESKEYNDAGNWVGILFAIQAIGSVLWAVALPRFRSRKFSYSLSLLLGAGGFISAGFFTNPYLLFVSFVLIGCAWAAMLAWPFTILTNSLKGGNIGAYLGLFNCSICIPQIIGALAGGWILAALGSAESLAPQYLMMVIAGISLVIGALCVTIIKEHDPKDDEPVQETPAISEI